MGKLKKLECRQIFLVLAFIALLFAECSRTTAAYTYKTIEPYAYFNPQKIRCTCYCEHRKTSTGIWPHYGIVAGKKEWIGLTCQLNRVNEDGSVGEFIGFFEFQDTGTGMDSDGDGKGDTIKNGTSIDVWVDSLPEAYAWVHEYGDYVYIKLIRAKG